MQPIISIVVAMNQDNVIGIDNKLPWHIPEDLQHFRGLTVNKPIIMGHNTFVSIGRVLPNRQNIVITRDDSFSGFDITRVKNLDEAFLLCQDSPEIFIIGGGKVFKECLSIVDKLYITFVDVVVENPTVFFPRIDYENWDLVAQRDLVSSSGVKYHFKDYVRRVD